MSWRHGWPVVLGLTALLVPGAARGSEIWAFRFDSDTLPISTAWQDDLIFHNTTGQDAVVRLLDVSNGAIQNDDVREISVPAGKTVSLWNYWGSWWPDTFPQFWVVHVEVPDGVLVATRGLAKAQCPSPCAAPPNPLPDLGAFAMPVFQSLVPAGTPQVRMGADLGTKAARLNVGLYNAASVSARATITVYQACTDTPLESRTVSIPANTALQVSGLGSVKPSCSDELPRGQNPWLRYAVVVMDQPGVSYVINVAEELPLWPSILFSAASGF